MSDRGRELVVVVKPELRLRAMAAGLRSLAGADVATLHRLVETAGAAMRPMFGASEDRIEHAADTLATAGVTVPRLSHYYDVRADDSKLDALAAELRRSPHVQAAYVKPAAEPPKLNDMQPKAMAVHYAPACWNTTNARRARAGGGTSVVCA